MRTKIKASLYFCTLIISGLFAQENLGNEVAYELSLVNKMLGDEYFQLNQRDSARHYYNQGQNAVKKVDPDEKLISPESLELLERDIEYRQKLLESHFDFWGVNASGKPTNPVQAYSNLKKNIDKLQEVYREITLIYNEVEDNEDQLSQAEAQATWNQYTRERFEIDESRFQLIRDFQEKTIDESNARLEDIINRQKQIDLESNQNRAAISNAVASMNDAILQGVKQVAGLPPEFEAIDPTTDRSLEERMLNTGLAMLGDESSVLSQQFGEVSTHLQEFRKIYTYTDSLYDHFENVKEIGKQINDALQKPTLNGLLELGTTIYSQLPEEAQELWRSAVLTSKPVGLLIELSEGSEELKKAVASELGALIGDAEELEALLTQYIDEHSDEASALYNGFLKELNGASLSVSGQEVVIETIIRNWPRAFLQQSDNRFVQYLKEKLQIATIPQLRERLKSTTISELPEISFSNGQLTVSEPPLSLDLMNYLNLPRESPAETGAEQLKTELKRVVGRLKVAQQDLLDQVIAKLPVLNIEQLIGEYLPLSGGQVSSSSKESLFSNITSRLNAETKKEVLGQMASLQVGSEFVSDNIDKTSNMPANPKSYSVPRSDRGDQLMEMAMAGALNYLAPGATAALQVWDKFNEVEGLVQKQNRLMSELKELTIEQLQMESRLDNARLQLGIATLEQEVAVLMQRAAKSQYDIYTSQLVRNVNRITARRAKIGLRLSYYYYLAEILRRDYYILDKSSQLWFDSRIEDLIRSNPQNLRYALDEDILLFNWLDRSIETQRGKLDSLTVHWERLAQLISDNCDFCKEHEQTTKVQQTHSIKLSELVPAYQWEAFLEWKNSTLEYDFDLYFSISPQLELINKKHHNIRVVRVRIGAMGPQGSIPLLGHFVLEHPGISWDFGGVEPEVEYLKIKPSSSLSDGYNSAGAPAGNYPRAFDLEELINRWNTENGRSLRPFEGYGLYTIWKLELAKTADIANVDDVYLRFAYQYLLEEERPKEAPYKVVLTLESGLEVEIENSRLETIGNRATIDKFLTSKVMGSDLLQSHEIKHIQK